MGDRGLRLVQPDVWIGAHLVNLTDLRAELEALERVGYGDCRVSVYPALSEDGVLGKHVLDFTGLEFTVCELDVPRSPDDGLVVLVFDMVEPADLAAMPVSAGEEEDRL